MTTRATSSPIRCSAMASPARKSCAAPTAVSRSTLPRARAQLAADRRHRALFADAAALRHAGGCRHTDQARRADAADCHGGVPVIRILFTIIAGVLLGGVVHLVSVLALP